MAIGGWLGVTARVVLMVTFVWYLYSVRFAPYRDQPFQNVDLAGPDLRMDMTVRAANAGYPFQLMFPSGDGTPPVVRRMSEFAGDYGIHILVSFAATAGQMLFGPSFQVQTPVARIIVLLLFVVTAAAMLVTPVPLPVGMSGVLSLWALFGWGALDLSEARYWGVAYAAVVGAVYLGTVLKPWAPSRVAVLILLAALAGYSQLLRQEAKPASYVAGLALLASAGVSWAAARCRATLPVDTAQQRVVTWRALGGGLLLILVTAAVVPLQRWCFSRAWGTSYADTSAGVHGSGLPLYLSLGYVSNPYNIGWRDPIGDVHAHLASPGLTPGSGPASQATLLREFERIVISRPWLLIRNVSAKAARVHELALESRTETVVTSQRPPIIHRPPLVFLYRALPWVMLGSLMLLAWRGTAEGVMVWFSSAALALGASAGALIVFPEYIGGLQGATVALVLVLPGAALGPLFDPMRENRRRSVLLARSVIAAYMALLLALAGAIGFFVAVQAWRYRELQTATVAADPVAAIKAQEFRYAHVFNDLTAGRQGLLLAELLASTDPSVARIDERIGNQNLFRPDAVVRTASQIHVFAWMGPGFVAPVPRLFQGATHASLYFCAGCPATTTVNDVQLDIKWTMISDLEWQGRYRMFSVPMSPSMRTAPSFRVAAERTLALDQRIVPLWLVPELIASARFSF